MRRTARGFTWVWAVLVLGVSSPAAIAAAQVIPPPSSAPDTAAPQKHKHLFNHRDVIIAGALTATTFALFPLDLTLAKQLQDSSTQANQFFGNASSGVELIASPGAYYIGGSLYLVGRLTRHSKIADLGWHGTESVMVGEGISYLLKGIMGRGRPYVSNNTTPRDFDWGRGFKSKDWRSFPSGHTTTAFAAASAVTDETTLWWPESTWIIGPVMYGGATLVGLSRMYHNKHWASDVALGALIGTFAGKKTVLATHDNPNNFIDRALLGTKIIPNKFGTLNIGWVKETK